MSGKCGILCSVFFCKNYAWQKDPRSFFRFPKDTNRCAIWVTKCKRQDLDETFKTRGAEYLYKNHRICSDHFRLSDLNNPNLKSQGLKRTAIPSLNLTAPSSENMGQSTMKEPRRSPKKRIRPSIEEAPGSPVPDRNDDSPLPVVMDVIKTEAEDTLTRDSTVEEEEEKSLSEEGNLLDLRVSGIKTECDPTFEGTPVPYFYPIIKCEVEERSCDVDTVKVELKQELTANEDEVMSESFADTYDRGIPSQSNCVTEEQDTGQMSPEGDVLSDKPYCHNYDSLFTRDDSFERRTLADTGESSMKCHICGKILATYQTLRRHLRTHTGEKPFKCDICGKCFTESGSRKDHARQHTGEKPFVCLTCGKCFSKPRYLRSHARKHTGEKPYKCNICGKCFLELRTLKIHSRQHTGEKPFKCDVCAKCFKQSEHLKTHARHHTGEKPFKCEICGKSFSQSGVLKRHIRLHKGEKQVKSSRKFPMDVIKMEHEVDPLAIDSSEKADTEGPNLSLIDGTFEAITVKEEVKWEVTSEEYEVLSTESILNSDLMEDGSGPEQSLSLENSAFRIELNPQTDDRREDTLESNSTHHTDEALFKCVICGEMLQTSHGLKMHIRRRHGNRMFKLQDHVPSQTGETPFKCKLCGMSFSKVGNLRIHRRLHSNENRFKCDTCGKLFPSLGNLTDHIRSHTGEKPFKCDVCGKCYTQAGSLTKHLRVHTGVKPYKCDECGKSFTNSTGLREHSRIHTGEKPYTCKICGKCFSASSSFRYHSGTHFSKMLGMQ
ncbi:zinc finger protein 665-like [Periplaneta americana]|uniref:zinc finger protein 665-like n=1 Tax=Periplaneta americana TaxID=6978 RepID=UPI0037E945A1